ncbi:MAG: U32 family peptidase [Clostridia bacterium]|nr:U32 family peptidase [Clostridia bacterium]
MLLSRPEILAPVGNAEMLYAAVRAGADAVYLGLNNFNARRNAENFTLESLREAARYCHVRGVKVYLTFNIIIGDSELKEALELCVGAAEAGIDAVIVTDIGFAKLIKEAVPSLPIHASTQMTVHSPAALKRLKEMGFDRVVVSREMSREELGEFCEAAKKLNIEVEVFVHGALCMCISGQCLLSSMLGSRSGNRGLCAGPCRLPFGCDGGTGYDLSLKDQSLIPYLGELWDMGVASLKIEGRMKRPEYVASAVAACRQMLLEGKVSEELSKALTDVFSRSGFTDGYYTDNLGKDMFGIRTKDDVKASAEVMSSLHELYRNEYQRIPLLADVRIVRGEKISLSLSDWTNYVTVYGSIPEIALTRPLEYEMVKEKISKTGGTPYFIEKINIDLEENLSVKVSEINELRRNAVEKLEELRSKAPKREKFGVELPQKLKPENKEIATVVRIEMPTQLTEAVKESALVVVPAEKNPEQFSLKDVRFAVDVPRGIFDEENMLKKLEAWKTAGAVSAFCGTLSAMMLAKAAGLSVICDFGLNVYNSGTANYFSDAKAIVLSPELLLNDAIRVSAKVPRGLISYGKLPLMITRNCPLKNGNGCASCENGGELIDRKDTKFKIRCRNGCSELLNSRPIWIADRKEEMKGLDFEVLYFTDENAERVDEVISAYKNLREPDCEYTRGLYFRGVD